MNLLAELKKFLDEEKNDLIQEAFRVVGQTKAEAKLGLVRGGLRQIERIEQKISQLEK